MFKIGGVDYVWVGGELVKLMGLTAQQLDEFSKLQTDTRLTGRELQQAWREKRAREINPTTK